MKHDLYEDSIYCDWEGYKICRRCGKKVYRKDYKEECMEKLTSACDLSWKDSKGKTNVDSTSTFSAKFLR